MATPSGTSLKKVRLDDLPDDVLQLLVRWLTFHERSLLRVCCVRFFSLSPFWFLDFKALKIAIKRESMKSARLHVSTIVSEKPFCMAEQLFLEEGELIGFKVVSLPGFYAQPIVMQNLIKHGQFKQVVLSLRNARVERLDFVRIFEYFRRNVEYVQTFAFQCYSNHLPFQLDCTCALESLTQVHFVDFPCVNFASIAPLVTMIKGCLKEIHLSGCKQIIKSDVLTNSDVKIMRIDLALNDSPFPISSIPCNVRELMFAAETALISEHHTSRTFEHLERLTFKRTPSLDGTTIWSVFVAPKLQALELELPIRLPVDWVINELSCAYRCVTELSILKFIYHDAYKSKMRERFLAFLKAISDWVSLKRFKIEFTVFRREMSECFLEQFSMHFKAPNLEFLEVLAPEIRSLEGVLLLVKRCKKLNTLKWGSSYGSKRHVSIGFAERLALILLPRLKEGSGCWFRLGLPNAFRQTWMPKAGNHIECPETKELFLGASCGNGSSSQVLTLIFYRK